MKPKKASIIGELDMFGNPCGPIKDRRGRKSYKLTKENQDFVAVRAAAGWTHDMIAEDIGCDAKTLRKYYSRELTGGTLIIEGMCLDVLLKKVREGHTPSVRQLQDRVDRVAPIAPRSPEPKEPAGDDAQLGKKEKTLQEATQADEEYGRLYDKMNLQ